MRALLRILLLGLLVAFLVHAIRRALGAAREQGGRDRRPRNDHGDGDGDGASPKQLVCGACGREFNPEQNGWICPSCGK